MKKLKPIYWILIIGAIALVVYYLFFRNNKTRTMSASGRLGSQQSSTALGVRWWNKGPLRCKIAGGTWGTSGGEDGCYW